MKNMKIGVFGCNIRGRFIARDFMLLGCDIVAGCDFRQETKAEFLSAVGNDCAWYDNFDEFIEHKMDAVVLANYFHEHAPYAIKCMEKGLHVYSECISNSTMAEGVELIEAFEKSNSIYMLAENYPQMIFNREMQRVCKEGILGKVLYAEGEYNHPTDPCDFQFKKIFNYTPSHWRNFLPRTYYVTHSLGPIMCATGATPKRVSALYAFAKPPKNTPTASFVGDRVANITTQNDDGSIFRFTGCAAFGAHHNSYRICGTKGQIENVRGMQDKIMLRFNDWEKPQDKEEVNFYEPQWNDKDEGLIKTSGHGGGDYLTARIFVESIKQKKQPPHPFDIYSSVIMSSVAILGHRSALDGGTFYNIPDFRLEEDKNKYRNDHSTPFYYTNGTKPDLPCCSKEDYKPSKNQIDLYLKGLKD